MKPFAKMSKTSKTFMLMFISVAILMLPALTITYAESSKITHIMTVQGNYVNGTSILADTNINQTAISSVYAWNVKTVLGESVTNDSAFYGYRDTAPSTTKSSVYWDDMLTYTGGGNYTVDVNYSHVPDDNYSAGQIIIQLDISNTEWTAYDFIKITHSYTDTPVYIKHETNTYYNAIEWTALSATEFIIIPSLSSNAMMDSNPDGIIWLVFGTDAGYTLNEDIDSFTFNIQAFNLEPADAFLWDDAQVYVLTILGCDIILIVGFLISTNFIDIEYDTSKPRKPSKPRTRKYRKRKSKR